MQELEREITLAKLTPEPPDAEVPFAFVGVMKHHHGLAGQLRQPALEIVSDRLIGVQPVDVQQIYGPVLDLAQRIVERALEQSRKGAKPLIMEWAQFVENLVAIDASVRVASPRVHSVTTCG